MYEFMKLEMRKHRFLFRGIVGAFLGTVLMSALLALSSHQPPLQFAALTTLCWVAGGWWLMPMLYGATSGAGLRGEPAASAEAGLPLSPFKKMAGALAAMWVYFTGLGFIMGLFALLLGPQIEGGKFSLPAGSEIWQIAGVALAALFVGFLMILIIFTCAYAFRHAIFGGMIGMLLCGVIAAGMVFGAMTHLLQRADTLRSALQSVAPGLILISLLTTAGALFSLHRLAQWGERRVKPGWLGWLLIGLGLGAGAFSAAGWLAGGYSGLSRQHIISINHWRYYGDPGLKFLPGARQSEQRYTLLETRNGALVSVDAAGKKTLLLPEDPRNPVELVQHEWLTRMQGHAWDVDGSLWVLVRTNLPADDGQFELWHGNADAPLKSHSFFKAPTGVHPFALTHRGKELGIIAARDGNSWDTSFFAPLPPLSKTPVFSPRDAFLKDPKGSLLLTPWIESGEQAQISADGKSLTRRTAGGGTQSWSLPDGATALVKAEQFDWMPRLLEAGGEKFFLVGVKLPDESRATAVCRLDGSVRLEWRGKAAPVSAVQDDESGHLIYGKAAGRSPDVYYFVLSADGRFLPPLEVNEKTVGAWLGHPLTIAKPEVAALWIKGTRLWLLIGSYGLVEVDGETGKLVKKWPLPEFAALHKNYRSDGLGPVSDAGFHYIAAGRLYHAGFDGVTKDLGPARLD